MGWESFGMVKFDLGPLLQGQTSIAKHKSPYNSLIIGPRGLGWYTNIQEIKCWESSGVVSVTVTGKHGSNYRLSLSCNRKSKKLNLTNLFNSQQ